MRFYIPTFGLFFGVFGLAACGAPQSATNPNGISLQPNTSTNACSPGAGGTSSNGDGITDPCKALLGLPANVSPDCNNNGIPNGHDDPKACIPGSDPNTCDAACQENRRRMYQELANSFALGGSSIGGQTYPGVNVLIKKKVFAFANSNGVLDVDGALATISGEHQRLTNSLCNSSDGTRKSNFYLYTFGDVTFESFYIGTEKVPATSATNVNFEICGWVGNDQNTFVPSSISNLNGEASGTLKVVMFGGFDGAYPIDALVDPKKQTASGIHLTPTVEVAIPQPLPAACSSANVSGLHLFDKMTAKFDPISSDALSQLVVSNSTGTTTSDLGGTFKSYAISENWKRLQQGFDCSRIISPAYAFGAGGFWVKD